MESPRKINGPVGAADVIISRLYIDFIYGRMTAPFDTIELLAQKLFRVMQLEEK